MSPYWAFISTCQFYMYCCGFIHCMKIPVIFFFKCAVHISLTELIKGNECFKSTSAFLIYRNPTAGMFLRSVHITHLLLFYFLSGLLFLSHCFSIFMDAFQLSGNVHLLYFTLSPLNGKGRGGDFYNEHPEMKSDKGLYQTD